jgi:3-hydroxyisobutyrate dehydrogenase
MGPQNALERTGIMVVSGEKQRFDELSPILSKMTGKLVYVGEAVEQAASFKLMGNLFLMFMTTGVAEMLKLAKASGVPAHDAVTMFDWFNPGLTLGPRVKRMLAANFEQPSWELSMARKDARLMMEAAQQGNVPLAVLPALAEEMDRWIERGHAHSDWTVIVKDAL